VMCLTLTGVHPLKLGDFFDDPLCCPEEVKSAYVFDLFRERVRREQRRKTTPLTGNVAPALGMKLERHDGPP
jgi:hypothetical protein